MAKPANYFEPDRQTSYGLYSSSFKVSGKVSGSSGTLYHDFLAIKYRKISGRNRLCVNLNWRLAVLKKSRNRVAGG